MSANTRKLGCRLTSVYPNLVRLYGYSSRNQKDKQAYVDLLEMRMKAKHGKLSDDFLKPMNLTNDDLKLGLKLPLNAFTGCLRAKFNSLYDNLSGFSICSTGQMLILQLAHDLKEIPTLELVSANTDALMYMIDEEYKEQAHEILHNWENLTGLELEEDKIVKIVMRDVNNYAEVVQVGDNDYEVHYKGGELTRGEHKFKWNKEEKKFEYSYKKSLKSNSMSIVSEALLKKLLFDIPIEETINKCNDIFRFQIISHLGSTYEKCVQESPDGDIELQRNNRIYAGNVPRGTIVKVKPDGRRDSLANCPINPIVDNGNECTINDINKQWYIDFTNEKYIKFIGGRLLEEYKKDELLELANDEYHLNIDKKTKKSELIKIIKEYKKTLTNKVQYDNIDNVKGDEVNMTKQELEDKLEKSISQNEQLIDKIKKLEKGDDNVEESYYAKLAKKLNEFRKNIRKREFILDKELPSNLGGGEYYSINQIYDAVQEESIKVGLDFAFNVDDVISFDKDCIKPSGRPPIHLATVKCIASFTDIDTGVAKTYTTIGQGSDTMDKAVSGASTMAFRTWFYKNFTPKNGDDETLVPEETEKSELPKVPVYIPEQKKAEIKEEVVKQEQHEDSDEEDIKNICENIMKVREKLNDNEWGTKTLDKIMSGKCTSVDLMEIDLKVKNKMEKVGL